MHSSAAQTLHSAINFLDNKIQIQPNTLAGAISKNKKNINMAVEVNVTKI